MIKIFLADNLSSNPAIDKIYVDLSRSIKEILGDRKITCNYKGTDILLDTREGIKSFLLANDFYNYNFTISSGFPGGLIKLQKNKLIKKAFDYKHLTATSRHKILITMDVPICPYCNMNFTLSYDTEKKRKTTADLDHFYIKSEYPEYGLCLYNFVPSCPVCNSKLKGKKSMTRETHIFPHEDSFNGKAKFKIMNLIEVLVHKKEQLDLKLVNYNNDEKVKQSAEIFKINELYHFHKGIVSELLENAIVYNESYTNELKSKQYIFEEKLDVKQLVFGANLSENLYARKSLGKLRMDLLNQLGVYKKDI